MSMTKLGDVVSPKNVLKLEAVHRAILLHNFKMKKSQYAAELLEVSQSWLLLGRHECHLQFWDW